MRDNIKAKYMFNLEQVAEKYDTYNICWIVMYHL